MSDKMVCRFCGREIVWKETLGWVVTAGEYPSQTYGTDSFCTGRPKALGGPQAGHILREVGDETTSGVAPCETCTGSGKIATGPWGVRPSRVDCPNCKGRGVVLAKLNPRSLKGVIADAELRIETLNELGTIHDIVLIDRMLAVLKSLQRTQEEDNAHT